MDEDIFAILMVVAGNIHMEPSRYYIDFLFVIGQFVCVSTKFYKFLSQYFI